MNGHSVDQAAHHRGFDHRLRQRLRDAFTDARTPQQPQIGDEEIHRARILSKGHQRSGGSRADAPWT
jgi:hypothetical protein